MQTQSPHFGSRVLAATIARVKPKLAFCGHIHTGDHRVHDMVHENGLITKIYNISRLDEEFVRAKGDVAKSASATAERMQRVRSAKATREAASS